ncbi:hypothetical protein DSM107007_52470 [Nostoc sp. PCC 7120 = FACHB-418]|nr:hypothetical protein DSM107007_52470 [Nostoc sp. PCC 7120 = FACHB-418]BAB78309.1 all7225 [Nostoc sp. PCC 7120 = FACHB-418]
MNMWSMIDEFDEFLNNPLQYIISYIRDIPKLIVTVFFSWIIFVLYFIYIHPTQNVTSKSLINFDSIGEIKIGMTVQRAEEVSRLQLLPITSSGLINKGCYYLEPQTGSGLERVWFMVIKDAIATIEVSRNYSLHTANGAQVGQSIDEVKAIYAKNLVTKDNTLVYTPAKKKFRIVFETERGHIIGYRVGRLPEVDYANGCFDYKSKP